MRGKSVRSPGASQRLNTRKPLSSARALWGTVSTGNRLVFAGLAVALGGLIAFVSGGNVMQSAAIGGGLALTAWLILSSANVIPVGVVSIVFASLSIALAPAYVYLSLVATNPEYVSRPPNFDPAPSVVTLYGAYLVFAALGIRWSRGKPWVTAFLVAIAGWAVWPLMIGGVVPPLGVYPAVVAMAFVTAWRCGVFSWLTGVLGVFWRWALLSWAPGYRARVEQQGGNTVAQRLSLTNRGVYPPHEILSQWSGAQWDKVGSNVRDSAKTMARILPPSQGALCLHSVSGRGLAAPLGHLLVARDRILIGVTVDTSGPLVESKRDGVNLPDVSMPEISDSLLRARKTVAKRARVKLDRVHMFIVLRGRMKNVLRDLNIYDGNDPLPVATIRVVSIDALDAILPASSQGGSVSLWSKVVAARMVRGYSHTPLPVATPDSQPKLIARAGDEISLATSLGVFPAFTLVSQVKAKKAGESLVRVCRSCDWGVREEGSASPGRKPSVEDMSIGYPSTSVCSAEQAGDSALNKTETVGSGI